MFELKDISLRFSWHSVLLASIVFIWLSLFLSNSLVNQEIPAMKSIDKYIQYDTKPLVFILTFSTYLIFWSVSLLYLVLAVFKYKNKETINIIKKKKRKK